MNQGDGSNRQGGGGAAASEVSAALRAPLPATVEVGRGTAIRLEGSCAAPGARIAGMRVRVGDNDATAAIRDATTPDELPGAHWWDALVPIAPVPEPEPARIALRVLLRGGVEVTRELGSVRLEPGPGAKSGPTTEPAAPDLVAICLPTSDPSLDLLRAQIESIRAQTHGDWTCIVSDDRSPHEKWQTVVDLVGDDERFRLHRGERARGSYLAFEQALRAVPPEAAYVALADQGDRWDPERLDALVAALGDGDVLAHSDARVVGPGGEAISPTLWPRKPPSYDRLDTLLLADGMPAASPLFRRSVLDSALPFPPPLGAVDHRRWITLVASVLGGVAYIDRPLYDHVRRFGATPGQAGTGEAGRQAGEPRLRFLRRQLTDLRRRGFRPPWRPAYEEVVVRSAQEAHVLRLRLGERMSPPERRTVDRIARLPISLAAQTGTLLRRLPTVPRRYPGREPALLRGIAWRRLVEVRALARSTLAALLRSRDAAVRPGRALSVAALRSLARLGVPLPRAGRRLVHVPASPRAEARLRAALADEEPDGPETGPRVSIVIVSRGGREGLERLLPALEGTRYRPLEVIVIENGSAEGSAPGLRARPTSLPLRVISGARGGGLVAAINEGVRASDGELVLLLDDDVEPLGSAWLGLMVETILERDASCVGARLIHPRRVGMNGGSEAIPADLSLKHRGIHFDGGPEGVPRPRPLGAGEDPRSANARSVYEVPAVAGACMLVRRRALAEAGMLDDGYRSGLEDADLCLRLRERGLQIVYDGRATLFQHELGPQDGVRGEDRRADRAHDRRRFTDRWGTRLHRQVLADRLQGTRRWSQSPLRVGITVTRDSERAAHGDYYTARELGAELRRLGFEVSYLEVHRGNWRREINSLDVVISLLDDFPLDQAPAGVVSVAWVRNWTERWIERSWFDDYDIVLASSERSRRLIEEGSSQVARLMPLATNPDRFRPTDPDPRLAADLTFAGSHWEVDRQIAHVLPELAGEMTVKVFGRGWDAVAGMDGCHVGWLAYDRLPAAYSSAGVVVDDSADHTRSYGSVNSRVFDALACGALVATNDAEGARDLFDDEFPVWEDAAGLRAQVRAARESPAAIGRLVQRYRSEVLTHHTYAHRARQIRDAVAEWCEATRFGICVGVARRELVENWGDYHFARSVQRQLERRGCPTRVHLLADWEREHPARDDVSLHLFGLSTLRPRQGQLSVIWNLSHPELVTSELLNRYDLALVASASFAAEVAALTETPVHVLHQATDPERFRPDPGPERYQLLFVGNSRRVGRQVVAEAARSAYELTIYGRDWTADLVDTRGVAGSRIPNAELHRHYSAADIVLNDHWPEMRTHGFLSNRLYDALACASCVISDHVEGIEEEFDGAVATFADGEGLRRAIDRLMADPGERSERGERGRRAVLERHTFDHRVDELLGWIRPLLAARPPVVAGGESVAPRPSEAAMPS